MLEQFEEEDEVSTNENQKSSSAHGECGGGEGRGGEGGGEGGGGEGAGE